MARVLATFLSAAALVAVVDGLNASKINLTNPDCQRFKILNTPECYRTYNHVWYNFPYSYDRKPHMKSMLNSGRAWCWGGSKTSPWLMLDLGKKEKVIGVRIQPRNSKTDRKCCGKSALRSWNVKVKDDANIFIEAGRWYNQFYGDDQMRDFFFYKGPKVYETQFVLIEVWSKQSGCVRADVITQ